LASFLSLNFSARFSHSVKGFLGIILPFEAYRMVRMGRWVGSWNRLGDLKDL
jgi:hypothetical protein